MCSLALIIVIIAKTTTKKEIKKEIKNNIVGPAPEEKAVEEQLFAERAKVSELIDNRTVVRNKIETCKFKGVDTRVGDDSGSDEDTDVIITPRLNKTGYGNSNDDNSDWELKYNVKDMHKVWDVTK